MSLTVKGLSGAVFVGPYRAVELGPWTFTSDGPGGGVVTARVGRVDGYWGSQPATSLRLQLVHDEWRWRLDAVDAAAGTYRVSGPPEGR